MSWITAIWSATAAVCLTLAGVHFLVWAKSRESWRNLLFSISATSAAICAGFELSLMHAQTPAQFGEVLRWFHVPLAVLVVSLIWFVRQYLQAGRLWLLWLFCGLRVVTLTLTFSLDPNLNFREITGLHSISAWGETIVSPIGVKNPWTNITHASGVVLLVFVVDAAIAAWRQGRRRRALVVGISFGLAVIVALTFSELLDRGGAPIPFTMSLAFLIVVLGMAYELSMDMVNANRLAHELRESQEHMSLATSAASLGVWDWDIVHDDFWVTDTVRERYGVGKSERVNFDRLLQSVHPDDRERIRQALHSSLESGEFEIEYRVLAASGMTRWIVARGQVERDTSGKPVRLNGISIDITARKHAEKEIQSQRAELAHISRVATMGQLSSALAHELNQPLGAILSNAEAAEMLLEADPPPLEQVREILADIRKDDERAGEVIRRMRALLRKRELEVAPLDIGEVVRDVLRLAGGDATLRKVTVRAEVDTRPLPARGDRVQLQQVVLNLLMNSIEAVAGNRPEERQVIVQAGRNRTGQIEVAVRDNGPGIAADQLDRLFEPFFTTKPNGMGMGTSIARTIVRAHQGRIWAENNPDGGATFRFTLPTAKSEGRGARGEEAGDEGREAIKGGMP